MLDEAADRVVQADVALGRWTSAMLDVPLMLDDDDLRRSAYADRNELLQSASVARFQVGSSLERLGMRLGREAPVVQRYWAVALALQHFADAASEESVGLEERLRAAATGKESKTSDEAMDARRRDKFKARDTFETARVAFVDAATELIKAHLPAGTAGTPGAKHDHSGPSSAVRQPRSSRRQG